MFVVLSPAKTLDYTSVIPAVDASLPRLLPQSESLNRLLREYSASSLSKLMSISDNIARLNVERNHAWQPVSGPDNARPALFAFRGDVYTGLQADQFRAKDIRQAQKRLRILSGLYGLLKPLDMMQPYRLEMGTALANPVIHKHAKPKPTQLGNEIDPMPIISTVEKERSANQTTKPTVANSPKSLIRGDNRLKSSRTPIPKITSDPKIIIPAIGFSPHKAAPNDGTVNPPIKRTTKYETKTAPPPSRGMAC